MSFGNKVQDIKESTCYMVSGVLSFAELEAGDVPAAFKPVGIIEGLSLESSPTKVQQKETMSGKNNIVKEIVTENIPTITVDFKSFDAENIAKFVYGELTKVIAATSEEVDVVAKLDSVVSAGFIMDGTVTVEDILQTIVYEEGKNYEVQDFDIFIYSTAEQTAKGAANLIAEDDDLTITADKPAQSIVEAFTKSSLTVAARFTGVNTADGDKPVIFEFHKINLDPASFDALSAEEFNTASVSGTILKAIGKPELYKVHTKD